MLLGRETIYRDGKRMGWLSSGGYGYTVGRNILCAYVAADEPAHSEYTVEVMGERYPALRHTRPPYDPERKAILACSSARAVHARFPIVA